MLNFHREWWNPVKKHSKALVFFAVSKQIPMVYSADRGRSEINISTDYCSGAKKKKQKKKREKKTTTNFQKD